MPLIHGTCFRAFTVVACQKFKFLVKYDHVSAMRRGFVLKVFIVMIPKVEIRLLSHVCPQLLRHNTCHTEHQCVCRGACN